MHISCVVETTQNPVYHTMISGFCCGVNEIFALLVCYTALIGSYRCFGTRCHSHL